MKNILLATLSVFALTSAANAFELGGGLALGGEVESSYNFGTENFGVLFTPAASFTYEGFSLTVDTEFDMLNLNADAFTGLDFEAIYTINRNISAYGEISTNADFTFGDLVVGTRLSF